MAGWSHQLPSILLPLSFSASQRFPMPSADYHAKFFTILSGSSVCRGFMGSGLPDTFVEKAERKSAIATSSLRALCWNGCSSPSTRPYFPVFPAMNAPGIHACGAMAEVWCHLQQCCCIRVYGALAPKAPLEVQCWQVTIDPYCSLSMLHCTKVQWAGAFYHVWILNIF